MSYSYVNSTQCHHETIMERNTCQSDTTSDNGLNEDSDLDLCFVNKGRVTHEDHSATKSTLHPAPPFPNIQKQAETNQ